MSTDISSREGRAFSAPALLVAGAFFMEFLDGTVIATALPDMATDFGMAAVDLNIGISAYLITLAVLIPASGWIADRWGRVPPLIIAKIMAVIGALLVMSSSSFSTIIIGRFFVGVSYGMDFAVAMAVVLALCLYCMR